MDHVHLRRQRRIGVVVVVVVVDGSAPPTSKMSAGTTTQKTNDESDYFLIERVDDKSWTLCLCRYDTKEELFVLNDRRIHIH